MPPTIRIYYAANRTAIDEMAIFLSNEQFTVSPVELIERLQISNAGRPTDRPNFDIYPHEDGKIWMLIARK